VVSVTTSPNLYGGNGTMRIPPYVPPSMTKTSLWALDGGLVRTTDTSTVMRGGAPCSVSQRNSSNVRTPSERASKIFISFIS
jgi:hypothetical protein